MIDTSLDIEDYLNSQGMTSIALYEFDSDDNDPPNLVWPRGTDIFGEENDLTQSPWVGTDASVTRASELSWDSNYDWYTVEATTSPTGRIQQSSLTVAAATYVCHVLVRAGSVNTLDLGIFIGAWIPPDSHRVVAGSGSTSVASNRVTVSGLDSSPTLVEVVWTLSSTSSALFRINPGTASAQEDGDSVDVGPCRLALLSEMPYWTYPGSQAADTSVNGLHLSYVSYGAAGLPAEAPALGQLPTLGSGRTFAGVSSTNGHCVSYHEAPAALRPRDNQCYVFAMTPGGAGSGDYLYQLYVDTSNYCTIFLDSSNKITSRIRVDNAVVSVETTGTIDRTGTVPIVVMINVSTSGSSIYINGEVAASTTQSTAGAHAVGVQIGCRRTTSGLCDLFFIGDMYEFRLIDSNLSAQNAKAVYQMYRSLFNRARGRFRVRGRRRGRMEF